MPGGTEAIMKKALLSFIIILLAASVFAADKPKLPLTPQDQKFLDDVYWIISDYERDGFLALEKQEDRDRFIQAFWDNRDPTPGTKENEFKEEHYQRLAYADKMYGRETKLRGSKTDRGRIYVLLGKPEFVKRIPASHDNVPMELWHYVGYEGYGIPSSLYLLFYQRNSIPPYRLYSPLSDGIRELFIERSKTSELPDTDLWDMLRTSLDPEIAQASISSIPSEGADVSEPGTSVQTEMVMAKLQNARNYDLPKRRAYVDAFLSDRPNVQIYYSIGTQGIHDGVYWFEAPTGDFYIDYSVEYDPDKLDMGEYNDYYTSLTVDGMISTTPDRKDVEQILSNHEIKVTPEQFEQIKTMPFQYQGRRPLLPGKYELTMIISNNVSRKSATFVQNINIPDMSKSTKPYITPVIPVRSAEKAPEDNKLRPFQFGDKVLTPNLPARFLQSGSMNVYHQVIFPDSYANMNAVELHYVIRAADKVEADVMEPVNAPSSKLAGNFIDITKAIPLSSLSIGVKTLVVELRDSRGVLAKTEPFTFTVSTDAAPAVWKYAVSIPGYNSGYPSFELAQQLFRLNRPKEARQLLEDAHMKDPDNLQITYQLMKSALLENEYDKVLSLGSPIEVKNPRNPEVLWLMGWAYYYQDKYEDALRFFERYRIEDPKRVEALNVLADVYLKLNQPDKCLERVQQSLALKPDQKDILELKKKLEAKPQ
jgi:GWxTD domain-containing protein